MCARARRGVEVEVKVQLIRIQPAGVSQPCRVLIVYTWMRDLGSPQRFPFYKLGMTALWGCREVWSMGRCRELEPRVQTRCSLCWGAGRPQESSAPGPPCSRAAQGQNPTRQSC